MLELAGPPAEAERALDSTSEQNLRQLLKDVEKLRRAGQAPIPAPMAPDSSYVDRFLERARAYYAKQDFKASLEILHDGLKLAPGNADILAFAEEVRKASERRQAELEESGLADRIAQCKAEAIKLFEQARYGDCIERFKLLSELEPTNSDLRHYLEVSREQAEKAQPSQVTPPLAAASHEAEISSSAPQIPELGLSAPSRPESLAVPTETLGAVDLEVPVPHSVALVEPSRPDTEVSAADEQGCLRGGVFGVCLALPGRHCCR